MALNKERLKNNIKAAYEDTAANGGDTKEAQLSYLCTKLADVIVDEIKELTINYTAGLNAPPGGGPVTGTITHTVS